MPQSEKIIEGKEHDDWIRSLELSHNEIGDIESNLLTGFGLNGLENLILTSCNIGPNGIEAICNNSEWSNLRELMLDMNTFGNKGCESLGRNTTWKNLKILNLNIIKSMRLA